jgi:flagellar hook-basal body complex protein FliE
MNISAINGLSGVSGYTDMTNPVDTGNRNDTFENLFQSALKMVNETNDLSNAAKEEEMKYALGETANTHDLQAAQQKANISLQYTVAVRNSVLDAYKEIMNIQF